MVWSNWQGAIWRGAGVMLLFWSGLAWTQSPAPRPADPADKIMVVHENGKSTRCRVLETWQLPDGRKAHLLEGIETGEKITIVTEANAPANPRSMSIRIFSWGQGRFTPPEGSPPPPHLRIDSGIVIKNEVRLPAVAVVTEGQSPAISNGADDTPLGGAFAGPGPRVIEPAPTRPGLLARMFPNRAASMQPPVEAQIVPVVPVRLSTGPDDKAIVQANGTDGPTGNPLILTQGIGGAINPPAAQNVNPSPGMVPGAPLPPPPGGPPSIPPLPPSTAIVPGLPTPPPPLNLQAPTNLVPSPPVVGKPLPPDAGGLPSIKPGANPTPSAPSVDAKTSWRPGEKIAAWWQGKPAKTDTKPGVPPEPVVINSQPAKVDAKNPANADDKVKKADDFLAQQNKLADKQLKEKVETIYKGAFSTATNPANPPDLKKPEPTPLAMPNATATKESKAAVVPPVAGAKEELKPAAGPEQEKRNMFGTGASQVTAPGRSVLDTPGLVTLPPPPVGRKDDPLMAPDRLPMPAKVSMLPPVAHEIKPAPAREFRPAPVPDMNAQHAYPPGAQSVLAARSGLDGPIAYLPMPVVTVPQPNRPPGPPDPALPDAPQLNAFVNAFSPPPAPKGAPQMPQQGMMPMMPNGNPMTQPMPPYAYGYPPPGYAPNPYGPQGQMMNPMYAQQMPYRQPMAVSQGPTANYARQYMGPLPPQNPFGPPMPAGYLYPPMMPQQPMIQPAGYQQMMQTPAAQTQQVEQLIKVMRENAYPAQREWAAQMLASYEWRMHPQIVPALLQSAAQDPAATVRAGCVTCLGRMQAAVEPVFGTLHAMRSDIDPRVRSAVEQAFVQLGQTPMAPQ